MGKSASVPPPPRKAIFFPPKGDSDGKCAWDQGHPLGCHGFALPSPQLGRSHLSNFHIHEGNVRLPFGGNVATVALVIPPLHGVTHFSTTPKPLVAIRLAGGARHGSGAHPEVAQQCGSRGARASAMITAAAALQFPSGKAADGSQAVVTVFFCLAQNHTHECSTCEVRRRTSPPVLPASSPVLPASTPILPTYLQKLVAKFFCPRC